MVTNRKVTGKAVSMPAGLAMGGGASFGLTLLLAVITAKLVDSGILTSDAVGYAALGILLVSGGAGAGLAAGKIKRQRLAVCMAVAAIYYCLLLSMTALFFGGQYAGMGVTAIAVAGGCGAVALAGAGKVSSGKNRRKIAHR